jgi:hypothetical protein
MNDTIELMVDAALASGGSDVVMAMIEAVTSLSPGQVAAALGVLAWGVCGLAIARILERRSRPRITLAAIDPWEPDLGEEEFVSDEDFRHAA